MKKSFFFSLLAFVLLTFIGCKPEPQDAVKDYLTAVQKGDYKKALDNVFFSNDADEAKTQREQFEALLEEKAKESGDEQSKIQSFEILSQEIDSDGGTASVKVSLTDNNGIVREQTIDLVQDNEGKWLLQNPK